MNKKQLIVPWSIILSYSTVFILLSTIAHASVTPSPAGISPKSPSEFKGEKDNNKDGKPDEIYVKEGNLELLKEDTDFDGKFNKVTYYENEKLIKIEEDINKDGQWDYRYWYKDGKPDRVEKVTE
ncbi:MAG: hypothetical protein WC369_00090 [Dehalococcoidales bacterium]